MSKKMWLWIECDNFVFHDIRGNSARAVALMYRDRSRGWCGKLGGWKVKARGSYQRFRSQIGLSALVTHGAHEPRLQVCRTNGPEPRKNKSKRTRAISAVSISSSRTGSGTVLMVFWNQGILISCRHKVRIVHHGWQLAVYIYTQISE